LAQGTHSDGPRALGSRPRRPDRMGSLRPLRCCPGHTGNAGGTASQPLGSGYVNGVLDEFQWRQNVLDVHHVMGVCQSLFLLLEHHNEAMVRVAVEIVTCKDARKCLWWEDFWYSDDDKRSKFKQIVKEKLAIVIFHIKGAKAELNDEEEDNTGLGALEAMKKRAEEAEALAGTLKQQVQVAEINAREANEFAEEAKERIRALEKAVEKLRAELRQKGEAGGASEAGATVEVASPDKDAPTKAQLMKSEQERQLLQQKLAEAERKLKELAEALAEAERKLREAAAAGGQAQKEAKAAGGKEEKAPRSKTARQAKDEGQKHEDAVADQAEKESDPRVKELMQKLKAAKQHNDELEDEIARLKEELAACESKCKEAEERALAAEKAAEQAQNRAAEAERKMKQALANAGSPPPRREAKTEPASPTEDSHDKGLSESERAELKELRKLPEVVEKLRAKLKGRDELIAKLREEIEQLQEERLRMLKTLAMIKEQLRRVTELAEKKGLGNVIAQILEESQVTDTLNSAEYTCFDRLYDDALRRMEKQRNIERTKGISGSLNLPWGGPAEPITKVNIEPGSFPFQGSGRSYSPGDSSSRTSSPPNYSRAAFREGQYGIALNGQGQACASCASVFTDDSVFCRKCGLKRPHIIGRNESPHDDGVSSSRSRRGGDSSSPRPRPVISGSHVKREMPDPDLNLRPWTAGTSTAPPIVTTSPGPPQLLGVSHERRHSAQVHYVTPLLQEGVPSRQDSSPGLGLETTHSALMARRERESSSTRLQRQPSSGSNTGTASRPQSRLGHSASEPGELPRLAGFSLSSLTDGIAKDRPSSRGDGHAASGPVRGREQRSVETMHATWSTTGPGRLRGYMLTTPTGASHSPEPNIDGPQQKVVWRPCRLRMGDIPFNKGKEDAGALFPGFSLANSKSAGAMAMRPSAQPQGTGQPHRGFEEAATVKDVLRDALGVESPLIAKAAF